MDMVEEEEVVATMVTDPLILQVDMVRSNYFKSASHSFMCCTLFSSKWLPFSESPFWGLQDKSVILTKTCAIFI